MLRGSPLPSSVSNEFPLRFFKCFNEFSKEYGNLVLSLESFSILSHSDSFLNSRNQLRLNNAPTFCLKKFVYQHMRFGMILFNFCSPLLDFYPLIALSLFFQDIASPLECISSSLCSNTSIIIAAPVLNPRV